MDERSPEARLLALLDLDTVAGSDIENRVMAQLEREEEHIALQAEVTALRANVAALRAEMAELKRILREGRRVSLPSSPTDSRGTTLLPYARRDNALPILG